MKLELKHLAPYLPFKPKMMFEKSGRILTLTGVEALEDGSFVYYDNKQPDGYSQYIWNFKLCLRPLSDLTKEIEVDRETINPIEEIYNDSWMALGYHVKDWGSKIEIISKEDQSALEIYIEKPHVNIWWVTQKLISMHFDIFGLIDAGLAIDINTLTK